MDLATLSPSTQSVAIRHPATGKATGLVIDVTSLDTPEVQAVRRQQLDANLKSRARTLSAEQIEENNLGLIIAAVVGWKWEGDAGWSGKKLDFTTENVRTVVGAQWLRRQIEEAVADEAAFFSN